MTYGGTFSSLASEVGQLKDKSSDVKRDVEAATRDGQTPRSEVLGWLSSVQDMEETELKQHLPQSESSNKVQSSLSSQIIGILPTTKTIGMEKVFEELQRHAKDDRLSVIGIQVMGGVGKTALLRRFNNDFPSETEADVVIFLELSIDYKLEEVQKSLFDRLSLTWQDEVTHRDRATKLFRVLSTLKFILLFDNLWEPLNYQVVGIPLPAPPSKCKIIFTTRTEDTCSHMGTEKMIKMECLEEEAAWNLFRNSARMDIIDTNEKILVKARDLVKECGGLPAALIVLAQAMAPKKTYDRLSSDNLRVCASYGALFKKESWISIFHDEYYFTMHPMTRAMILWVQRECGKENKLLVRVEEAPAAEKWRDAERIALVWNQIRDLPEAPQCPNLVFLNLHVNKFLRKIPNGFFLHMPHLKILDLRDTSIRELPVSIGCPDLTTFNIPSMDFHAETMLRLIRIQLHAMSELEELVIGNHQPILLPLLELRLSSLPKAKLVWRPTFPNTLLALKIEGCGAIDRLIKLEGEANGSGETVITIFPDLHTMVLRRLPKLKSLSDGERILNFPSLKTIKVEDCPKLTKLKLVADGLKEVECERSWWEQLNWGDERTKSFQHLYKPMYID
ncbi:hypothetical protein ZIOFF_004041 [Zingiber officinale]|uniref:NB-ARC domain-containing protein n=1 Tax=Zingiber officinale TaxID=94328 RepID=A0A8J5LTX1_ZINOF|nr:hypothetical protein ZIOFF_004041 [Zingiber officinale]